VWQTMVTYVSPRASTHKRLTGISVAPCGHRESMATANLGHPNGRLAWGLFDKRRPAGTSGLRMDKVPAMPDEDELDELPPLDGETGDSVELDDEIDPLGQEVGDAALDDTTAEDEPPDTRDLLLDEDETSWLGEPPDAPDLDLGEVALVQLQDDGFQLEDGDDSAVADEDVGLAETVLRPGLDTGDEGPLDADEELRDEDLPALDADDEGELADSGFVDARFAADEPLGLPWASVPWTRVGAPLEVFGATAIACGARGALVCGRLDSTGGPAQLVHVDLEGARQTVGSEGLDGTDLVALAAGGMEGHIVAVVLRGGRVAVSMDGGLHFESRGQGVPVADVAVASGTVWLRARSGALLSLQGGDAALGHSLLPGAVVALATEGPDIVALVVDNDRRPLAVVRGSGGIAIAREPIDGPEVRVSALVAARGRHLAYTGRTGVIRRGPEGPWRSYKWEGRVTALAFVDEMGTLLAATYSEADDTTGLVRLDSAGAASVVARIGALRRRDEGTSDGRALGMACDDAHGVVWIAGGFGLAAFAIAAQ
jgi:hypothetical protein